MTRPVCLWIAVLLTLLGSAPSHAQEVGFGRLEGLQTNATVYGFARPGDATKRIYLWGAIQRPGLYEVEVSTDLSRLLSLAGGPAVPVRADDIIQHVTLRLYRAVGGTRQVAFESSVDSLLQQSLPMPQEDDVIEIRVSQQRIRERNVLPYITASASVVTVLVSMLNLLLR